ncbi:50S ribosomal protein L4 [Caldicellulosiruptoraceae bacterium PP1]
MPKVPVYNIEGHQVGEYELSDLVFGIEVNEHVLHQAVVAHLANRRQGTFAAKTRSEVRGGGRKPWRQKGTGRARQGSITAPTWRKGGVVFAKKPRDFSIDLPKKVKRLALKSALSLKVKESNVIVIDKWDMNEYKTKEVIKVLKNLGLDDKKALIVIPEKNEFLQKSTMNIPTVKTLQVGNLNVFDILKYEKFIILQDAAKKVEEVYA